MHRKLRRQPQQLLRVPGQNFLFVFRRKVRVPHDSQVQSLAAIAAGQQPLRAKTLHKVFKLPFLTQVEQET